MNKDRRASLDKSRAELSALHEKFKTAFEAAKDMQEDFADIRNAIESDKDDESEAYDNMPEGMQNGDKGSLAQEAIDYLDTAISKIDEFVNALENFDVDDVINETIDALADASSVGQ